mgnify:CR=1 FL=1
MGECGDSSHTILEVEHLGVTIICGIHLLQSRICIQDRLACLNTVILYQSTGNIHRFRFNSVLNRISEVTKAKKNTLF